MDLSGVLIDSLIYPFLELKKFLLLGILVLASNLYIIPQLIGTQNRGLIIILYIVGFIFAIIAQGYVFRNIKFSLEDVVKLPEFNNWKEMFTDGIKVFLVSVIYVVPAILIQAIQIPFISILYLIIIAPIVAMAIAHMANNDSKLKYAFKFREIIYKIGKIGWGNLIKWYIVNGIILMIISFIIITILPLLIKIDPSMDLFLAFITLILAPYIYLYLSRSIALVYKSG